MMEPNSLTTTKGDALTQAGQRAHLVGWSVEIGYAAMVAIPILLMLFMFTNSILISLRNHRLIQRSLVQMKMFPQSEANPSLVKWHAQQTSTEHTRRYLEFESAANFVALQSRMLNQPSIAQELTRVVPKEDSWEAAPLIDTLSRNGSSVIAELDALPVTDTPVWKPLDYDRFHDRRPFGDARYVTWEVLRVEFQDAFHKGEMDRALKAIMHLERFCVDPSQSLQPPVEMFYHSQWLDLVSESIQYEQWSVEHLLKLQVLVSRRYDFTQLWHQTLATDALLALPWAYDRERMGMFGPNYWSEKFRNMREQPIERKIAMSSVAPSEAYELFNVLERVSGSESQEAS